MPPLFCNSTTLNDATSRDFLALTWRQNARVTRPLMALVGLFAAGWGTWQWLQQAEPISYAVGMWLLCGVALFLAFFGWLLRLQRYAAAQRKAWGGATLPKTVCFYEHLFEQHSPLGTLRFGWHQVTAVRKNRRALLLCLGRHHALLLRRGAFTTGSEADFIRFAKRKIKENKMRKNSK